MDSKIYLGDNLEIMRNLPSTSVRLIYVDPPFGTGNIQQTNPIGNNINLASNFYGDLLTGNEYLQWLDIRLREAHRLLKSKGSIYLHLDHRYAYKARILLDNIFGEACFINEIIWAYDYGGRPRDRWPKKHDTILWYAKVPGRHIFNYDDIERIPYMAPGLVGPEKAARGKLPTDVWWMTIVPTNGRERTGYPNQKPLKLIERIIEASSEPDSVILDFCCGSGTTGVAAKKLGRKYILIDNNPAAIRITERRLETLV